MRLAFVVPELRPSGGLNVVTGHARRLAERTDFEVDVVVTEAPAGAERHPALSVIGFREATGRQYDMAVGTWWDTWTPLMELPARRRGIFLQSLEARFYAPHDAFDRLLSSAVLALPVHVFTVAEWMRRVVTAGRPDVHPWVVPNGLDHEVFGRAHRADRPDGPLRVLVEGQPSLWFKGVEEAVGAARAMRQPVHVTGVALDPDALAPLGLDRVAGGLSPAEMADVYSEVDVLVKLARVEGLGMAPVEAAAAGVPSIVTPYTGHEEVVRHGENGLVVGFDDPATVTDWLDRLAQDRGLLRRLGDGARETARAWPGLEASTDALAAALQEALDGPAPSAEAALTPLARTLRLGTELGRLELADNRAARAELERVQPELLAKIDVLHAEIDRLNALVGELSDSREDCARLLRQAQQDLEDVRATRAYRAAVTLRRVVRKGG